MGLDEDRARRRSGGSRRASVLGNSWNTMDSGVRLFTRRGRIILVIVAFFRELLGSGTLFGYQVIPQQLYDWG